MNAEQPDIVLIHGHDLGRWLGTYGLPTVPSPNIDRFAAASLVFHNAHAAAPLCSPARAALFTGIAPHRNGVQGLVHNAWRYREGVVTAPERLRALGYETTLVGLQHENVDPTVLGFDHCFGLGFLPRANAVEAAATTWLKRQPERSARRPLFLTVGTWEVHRPWPHEDYEPGDPATVDVPGFLPDNTHTRADVADYYGSIRYFDAAVGRLLATIDGALDPAHTLVILTTDHGSPFPRAKSTLYDAGTGVTLIMRPPTAWGVAPRRVTGLVSHLDILPTLIELAGGEVPADLEGRSLLPLITGADDGDPGRVIFTAKSYHDSYDPKRAARTLDWVYIRNYEPGPTLDLAADLEASETRQGLGDAHLAPRPAEELYDRRSDPDELHNVAAEATYAATRDHLAGLLHDYLTAIGDPIETTPLAQAPARTRTTDPLPPVAPLAGRLTYA